MKSNAQSSEVGTLSLKPMTANEAKMVVRRMMACYPSQKLADPEIYLAELVTILCGYPKWAAEIAIKAAKKETIPYIPAVPVIERELDEQVRSLRYARDWELAAQENRKRLAGPDFTDPEYRRRMREKLESLANDIRKRISPPQKSIEATRQELIAQVGQEAFDAIPDLPAKWPSVAEAAADLMRKARATT